MTTAWLHFLNVFFFVFHTLWMAFNMAGWAWARTRPLHRWTMGLTAFSWFILGIWYGWGYCVCTDWHWDVRRQLGYVDRSRGYVHFLLHSLTGWDAPPLVTDVLTGGVFGAAALLAVAYGIRDASEARRRRRADAVQGFPEAGDDAAA